MKRLAGRAQYGAMLFTAEATLPPAEDHAVGVSVTEVARREADFLWLTLQRLGVRTDDCHDVLQQVLLTVHTRGHTYDGRAPLRAWLYGICVRHAAAHRRRAWVRRERPTESADLAGDLNDPGASHDPEAAMLAAQERERVRAMIDELDPEKRAMLVMFEVEERSCESIADELGIPRGTVHSRLFAARKALRAIYDAWTRRESRSRR